MQIKSPLITPEINHTFLSIIFSADSRVLGSARDPCRRLFRATKTDIVLNRKPFVYIFRIRNQYKAYLSTRWYENNPILYFRYLCFCPFAYLCTFFIDLLTSGCSCHYGYSRVIISLYNNNNKLEGALIISIWLTTCCGPHMHFR